MTPLTDSRLRILSKWQAWTRLGANERGLPPLQDERDQDSLIVRPVTRYNTGSNASMNSEFNDSEASTSSLDPLLDYVTHKLIPRSPTRAGRLVLLAHNRREASLLAEILLKIRDNSNSEVEEAALLALLRCPVQQQYHAHRVRSASLHNENQVHKENLPISQKLLMTVWRRLWELRGETLKLEPDLAKTTLEILLDLPVDGIQRGPESGARALRHLLFLAGLDRNPALALDLLAHIIVPHALVSIPHLADLPYYSQSTTAIDDIPLVLHDLLRAGIITSSVIKEFDLSETYSKASTLSAGDAHDQLGQTLLRMIVRTYANMQKFHRATLLLRYLKPLEGAIAGKQHQKDAKLTKDVCIAALHASSTTGKWVGRVAIIITSALLGKLRVWPPKSGDEGIDSKLLKLYFDTALPFQTVTMPLRRIKRSSASLVWKALHTCNTSTSFSPSLDQMSRLLNHFSRETTKETHELLGNFFSDSADDLEWSEQLLIIRHIQEYLKVSPHDWTFSQVNDILFTLLTSGAPSSKLRKVRGHTTLQIYGFLVSASAEASISAFTLRTDNLVPLVKLIRSLPDPTDDGSSREEEADLVIHRYLKDRQGYRMLDPVDMTSVAAAFFENDDREAGLRVFRRMLEIRRVPRLADLKALFSELAKADLELAANMYMQAIHVGLKPIPEIGKQLRDQFHGNLDRSLNAT